MNYKFNIAGTNNTFSAQYKNRALPSKKKKRLRIEIASNLTNKYLPLHAVLLKGPKNILISGPSGSGKTTLAKMLERKGYKILANDFVIAWLEGEKLVAGDLNFIYKNHNKKTLTIDKIVLLDSNDKRDLFRFNKKELNNFYINSFDCRIPQLSKKLTTKIYDKFYKIHFALGNRTSPEKWSRTLLGYLNKGVVNKIGIIGIGAVGEELASLLTTQEWIKQINLFSLNKKRLKGISLDLKSANPKINIHIFSSTKHLIKHSEIVILLFKSQEKETAKQERFQRLKN